MRGELSEYRRKRSKPTPEPSGEGSSRDGGQRRPGGRFVVHEHHARRLHWDLRLEHEGVLASWAIPNGIPEHPDHNRKAVHVEDHPLDYIDFAGVIPQGSYGAGEVKIWDHGTYSCEKWESTKVVLAFDGERLQGRYALFQAGKQEQDWMIHRIDPPLDPDAEPMPELVQPMLAKLSSMPAQQSRWAFEVKWDGVRALARCEPGRIHLLARNGKDVTAAYPELRDLSRALGSREMLLDGEIVAFDTQGRPSFQALQTRMHLRGETAVRRRAASTPVTYLIFDLLWLQGHSLMQLPYERRRELLDELKLDGEHWRTPANYVGQGEQLLEATAKQGLEGVIAKRLDSPYSPRRRDGSWLKIKNHRRQEAVIGGWTEGKGARLHQIGALELGVHDDEGHLRYAGRVGTGFDSDELDRLARLLDPLARDATPFTGRQPVRGAHFVEPQLVCEVEFSEWTDDGRLRQASYQGLRDDKPAAEVVREVEAPPPEASQAEASPSDTSQPAASHRDTSPAKASSPEARRLQARRPKSGEAEHATSIDASLQRLIANAKDVRGGIEIGVEGRTFKLTNLDKVLYPSTGFTKGDLIGWYAAIAPTLLPHLRRRPLTLKRYPDGVDGKHFYEKQSPRHRPEWVQTVTVWSEHSKRDVQYTLCEDLPTLVWLANLADIELHPSLSLADAIERPTTLAFDLDPGPPAEIPACCEVALELQELFGQFGLKAFAKTSGSKGLQVYVPLNDPHVTYEQTKPFAHAVAGLLERRHPERVVSAIGKAERKGKVLIDWSQNDEHKTTVSVYSLRARERPTVSTPVSWEEVQACTRSGDAAMLRFEAQEILTRAGEHGDLFAEVLSLAQQLTDLTQTRG
jgi:bifunctional non-homologous end joining protein LigD